MDERLPVGESGTRDLTEPSRRLIEIDQREKLGTGNKTDVKASDPAPKTKKAT